MPFYQLEMTMTETRHNEMMMKEALGSKAGTNRSRHEVVWKVPDVFLIAD